MTLIAEALEIIEQSKPASFAEPIEISPEQALVHSIYLAARDVVKPYGSAADLERYKRAAVSAGIPQVEIDAAEEAGQEAQ